MTPEFNFIETENPEDLNIVQAGKDSVVSRGSLRSPNFSSGVSGWAINAAGDAEFNSAVLRRNLLVGKAFYTVAPGEDIQAAIDAVNAVGGGVVYLQAGTHTPGKSLTLYSGVDLQGQSSSNTVLSFGSAAYQILISGSNGYTTGTVTINYGSTTVEGAGGMTWTAAMAGRRILLDGFWYTIASVTDGDTLELATAFGGQNLAGASYAIATTIRDIMISDLTITASTTASVKVLYADVVYFYSVIFLSNSVNLDVDYSYSIEISWCYGYYSTGIGFTFDKSGAVVFRDTSAIGSGSHGITFNTCTNSVVHTSVLLANTGDGINITSSTAMGIMGSTLSRNGGQGMELVSGNNGLSIIHTGAFNNTSDGIKLTATSDNCVVTSCILQSNGGYGVNIAAATCDGNIVKTNNYYLNTSGAWNDAGTGSQFETQAFSAGTSVIASANTERSSAYDAYTLVKAIQVVSAGTVTVSFDLKTGTGGTAVYGKIYKNTVAVGTERSDASGTYQTFTENFEVARGDTIQLYAKRTGAVSTFYRNFQVKASIYEVSTAITD